MKLTRRSFTTHASAAVLATAAHSHIGRLARADSGKSLPIIDTHQHLWDLSKFDLPWLKEVPAVLKKSYVTKDFLEATSGLNVVKAVYMEVDLAENQQVAEAEHVIALSKSDEHPTAAAVISGRPNSEQFASYIRKYEGNRYIQGVRQVLLAEGQRGFCLQKQFVKSIQLLGEMGMCFDLCMRPEELEDGVRLAKLCPRTRFVVDHCGNADPKAFLRSSTEPPTHKVTPWRRDMADFAQQPNVICKISGIVARVPQDGWDSAMLAPIVNYCLDQFGPQRVVFGGDWPVCLLGTSYRRWVNALQEVIGNRSEVHQRSLLHDNAQKFYRLA